MTTKVSQELYEDVYKLWDEVCKTLPADAVLHYTIQPFGKAGVQAGKDRGDNIMGHESIPQCCMFIVPIIMKPISSSPAGAPKDKRANMMKNS